MECSNKVVGLGVLAGAVAVLLLGGVAGLAVVYGGLYNVAATEEHASLIRWAFDTTFHNSIERRAGGAMRPDISRDHVMAGATRYKAMCQHCHAGPGVERSEWAAGMRPRPPYLAEAAAHWDLDQVFWIAKHGIKMTGMPAFGPTHDDDILWGIAAFVTQLPGMTPGDYAAAGRPAHGQGH